MSDELGDALDALIAPEDRAALAVDYALFGVNYLERGEDGLLHRIDPALVGFSGRISAPPLKGAKGSNTNRHPLV